MNHILGLPEDHPYKVRGRRESAWRKADTQTSLKQNPSMQPLVRHPDHTFEGQITESVNRRQTIDSINGAGKTCPRVGSECLLFYRLILRALHAVILPRRSLLISVVRARNHESEISSWH